MWFECWESQLRLPQSDNSNFCDGMDCICMLPQNSYVETLISNVVVFGDKAFARQLGHEDGALMMGLVLLWEETQESLLIFSLPLSFSLSFLYEDMASRHLSANEEEGSHQEPNCWSPWSWTSQPPPLWEINFYCLSHTVYGILIIAVQTDKERWKGVSSVSCTE